MREARASISRARYCEDAIHPEGPGWPYAAAYRGRAAALERMQSLIGLVGPIALHLDELIDVGDSRPAVRGRSQLVVVRVETAGNYRCALVSMNPTVVVMSERTTVPATDGPAPEASVAGVKPKAGVTAKDVLVVADVKKSFRRGLWPSRKRIDVLNGVDLVVRSGELVGVVGENGSGKSTLMKIIVGLLDRDSGTVERTGSLGYCPQLPLLWDKLTVAEHFELYARAYGLSEQKANEALDELLDSLQFGRYRDYRIEDLSGGTRQKVNLAISLMHEPDLLLLDEPYTGFDWETYLRFWDLSQSRRDRGMAILIVTHMITENERLDRVINLRDGQIEAK